jgi:hypothetical protein
MFRRTPLSRALQVARSGASYCIAAHAGFADVDAPAHLLRIIAAVQLRGADPLLIGILSFSDFTESIATVILTTARQLLHSNSAGQSPADPA